MRRLLAATVLSTATLLGATGRAQPPDGGPAPGTPPWSEAAPQEADDGGSGLDASPGDGDAGAAGGGPDAGSPLMTEAAPPLPGAAGPEARPDPPPGPAVAPPEPSFVPVPVPVVDPRALDGVLPGIPQGGPWTAVGLLALLLIALIASSLARRIREALPAAGLVPRLAELLQTGARLAALLLVLGLLTLLLPATLAPGLSWMLLALAAAVGWSARDVLPDLVAGVVLLFERRVRPGVWLSAGGHSGMVERRGLRATSLRDVLGHRIAIPNRVFLAGTVVSEPGGAFHDVTLRFEAPGVVASRLRQALEDAVLTSPWTQPDAASLVRRDGRSPELWHVRARLIDVRFAVRFEGDLLERAEEMLSSAHRARTEDDWD